MNKKYFLYDPGRGIEYFNTERERDDAAAVAIVRRIGHDGFSDKVSDITAGIVTHSAIESEGGVRQHGIGWIANPPHLHSCLMRKLKANE